MSDKDRTVEGKIEVKESSEARVAYDLMRLIGDTEKLKDGQRRSTREYWLALMQECIRAVKGFPQGPAAKTE